MTSLSCIVLLPSLLASGPGSAPSPAFDVVRVRTLLAPLKVDEVPSGRVTDFLLNGQRIVSVGSSDEPFLEVDLNAAGESEVALLAAISGDRGIVPTDVLARLDVSALGVDYKRVAFRLDPDGIRLDLVAVNVAEGQSWLARRIESLHAAREDRASQIGLEMLRTSNALGTLKLNASGELLAAELPAPFGRKYWNSSLDDAARLMEFVAGRGWSRSITEPMMRTATDLAKKAGFPISRISLDGGSGSLDRAVVDIVNNFRVGAEIQSVFRRYLLDSDGKVTRIELSSGNLNRPQVVVIAGNVPTSARAEADIVGPDSKSIAHMSLKDGGWVLVINNKVVHRFN